MVFRHQKQSWRYVNIFTCFFLPDQSLSDILGRSGSMRLPIQLPGMMKRSPFQKPHQLTPFSSHALYKQPTPPVQERTPTSQQNQQHPASIQVKYVASKILHHIKICKALVKTEHWRHCFLYYLKWVPCSPKLIVQKIKCTAHKNSDVRSMFIHTVWDRDKYRELNQHNRKQRILVPFHVSDLCEHFRTILGPIGPGSDPCTCPDPVPVLVDRTKYNNCETFHVHRLLLLTFSSISRSRLDLLLHPPSNNYARCWNAAHRQMWLQPFYHKPSYPANLRSELFCEETFIIWMIRQSLYCTATPLDG